jgi:hypothetical protein
MVLFTEQVRLQASEQQLLNDANSYTIPNTPLGTIHDYGNIVLAADSLVIFRVTFHSPGGGSNWSWIRIKVGSLYLYGAKANDSDGTISVGAACYLAAGTYDVKVEGVSNGTIGGQVTSLKAGIVKFLDQAASALQTYSSGIPLTVPNRTTCVGPLSQCTFAVQVQAQTAAGVTNFENVGDNLTNGVSITVDGTQYNWSERYQDTDSEGCGSAKLFIGGLSVGLSHTIAISKKNAATTVYITIVACPWILPDPATISTPMTLDFSQGSTFYSTLEPLFADITKFIGVGQPRAISFGSATDYYNSTSATGIVSYSYVFDVVDIGWNFGCYGLGGCISIIGVDAR